MPEHALRRLADDAGKAAELPEFRDLVQRARRRRRGRHTNLSLAALVCIALAAAGVFVAADSGPGSAPPVTRPSPTVSSTPNPSPHYLLRHPAALVNQPGAVLVSASYADADHATAYWQVCTVPTPQRTCPEVVTWTSDGWRTSRARVIPDKLVLYALHDGSVVVWLFDKGLVLDSEGHVQHLSRSRASVAASPNDRYVNLPSIDEASPAGMLDTHTGTVYRPLSSPSTRCVYDDRWDGSGAIWEDGDRHCGGDPHTVAWSSDLGGTWTTRHERRPILGLAVTAHRTAVLLASQYNELAALDITSDGGVTWHRVVLSKPIVSPDGFATTTDGTFFVTSSGLFAANSSWTSFRPVQGLSFTAFGLTAGDGVVATYPETGHQLAVSHDDGSTWQTVSPRPPR
jgi:hypothetical protein